MEIQESSAMLAKRCFKWTQRKSTRKFDAVSSLEPVEDEASSSLVSSSCCPVEVAKGGPDGRGAAAKGWLLCVCLECKGGTWSARHINEGDPTFVIQVL